VVIAKSLNDRNEYAAAVRCTHQNLLRPMIQQLAGMLRSGPLQKNSQCVQPASALSAIYRRKYHLTSLILMTIANSGSALTAHLNDGFGYLAQLMKLR
jgi:hypothetical protein